MKLRSLSLHVVSFFFLMAAATSGLAQGGPGGGGAGSSLQTQVTVLQQQVAALQTALNNEIAARIAADQAQIQALQEATQLIQALQPFISVNPNPINGLTGPHVIFSGANVHVRSGSGNTQDAVFGVPQLTGLGNLIVGYNEQSQGPVPFLRTGSHNLVVGQFHTFTSWGGFVAGSENIITADSASITGGEQNKVEQRVSVVVGGSLNQVIGVGSVVSGGIQNTVSGNFSTVNGGQDNTASGNSAAVSGGRNNVAGPFNHTTVSGGQGNTAAAPDSTVSGGTGLQTVSNFQHVP